MVRILALALLAACSSSKDKPQDPPAPAPPAPAAPADDSPRALCTRGCTKLVTCAGVKQSELPVCIDTCAGGSPQKAQIEQLEAMTCEQINANGGPPERAP